MKFAKYLKHLFVAAFLLAGLGAPPVFAQAAEEPVENGENANAEAREQFSAAITAATEASEAGTAEDYATAAEKYTEAAGIAAASGDPELESRIPGVQQAAVKAYVDAGTAVVNDEALGEDRFDQAIAYLEMARTQSKEMEDTEFAGSALMTVGKLLMSKEQFEPAALFLQDAMVVFPANEIEAGYLYAMALRSAGNMEDANKAFATLKTKATEAGDEAMVARVNDTLGKSYLIEARDALQADKYGTAIAALDNAKEYLGEDDATLNTFYANAYYKQGVSQVNAGSHAAAKRSLNSAKGYAEKAGKNQLVDASNKYLTYIAELEAQQQ